MNEAGKLNLKRFEVFMDAMGSVDRELFQEKYEDLKYMESKQNNNETFGNNFVEITAETKSDLNELIKKTVSKTWINTDILVEFAAILNAICFIQQNLDFGSDESSSESLCGSDDEFMFGGQDPKEVFKDCEEEEELTNDELFEKEFKLHKRDYYINKLKYPEMTE